MRANAQSSLLSPLKDLITFFGRFEFHAYGVEEFVVENCESLRCNMSGEILSEMMHLLRDGAEAAWSMVDRVHRSDYSEEHLGGANVTCCPVPANMLFSRLEREPKAGSAGCVVRDANKATGHVTFISIAGCEIRCMWSTKTE